LKSPKKKKFSGTAGETSLAGEYQRTEEADSNDFSSRNRVILEKKCF